MANYPCPVCGASHKAPPAKCRLCGQLMGEDAEIGDFSGSRQMATTRKGVGGIAVVVALGVVAIALAAVLLGVLPGRESVSSVASRVPGLAEDRLQAGWAVLDASEEGFTVQMPSASPEQTTETRTLLAQPREVDVWSAWIGEDTLVEVAVARDVLPAGAREFETVQQVTDEIKASYSDSRTATVESNTEMTVQGHPARKITVRNVRLPDRLGIDFYRQSIVFFDDGDLYLLSSYSVDPTSPSFDTMSRSFRLKSPTEPAT